MECDALVPITGLIIGLIVTNVLILRKTNLRLAVIVGACVIILVSGHGFGGLVTCVYLTFTDMSVLLLLLSVALVSILTYILIQTGSLQRVVEGLTQILGSSKAVLTVMPAIMGILAVPGGAIASAPMVDEAGKMLDMTPEEKTAANILFRHMVQFVNPFSQSMIAVTMLLGISVSSIIKRLFPVAVIGLCSSWYFVLSDKKDSTNGEKVINKYLLFDLFKELSETTDNVPKKAPMISLQERWSA